MKEKVIYNYITTNLLNGKQYVGMHSTDNVDDGYLGSGTVLLNAIKKHGKENFKREILKVCETVEEAFANEMVFIGQYDTVRPNGYNISPTGGFNIPGCHSEETLQKMSLAQSGENHPMYGKKHSKETIQKMSLSQSGENHHMFGKKCSEESIQKRSGENHHMFGKKHSEESIQKMSLARSGENNPMYGKEGYWKGKKRSEETIQKINKSRLRGENHPLAKKVIHLSSGDIYDCIKDCADFMDIKCSTLSSWLNGKGSRKNEFKFLENHEPEREIKENSEIAI